jgi:hypothetical protein
MKKLLFTLATIVLPLYIFCQPLPTGPPGGGAPNRDPTPFGFTEALAASGLAMGIRAIQKAKQNNDQLDA